MVSRGAKPKYYWDDLCEIAWVIFEEDKFLCSENIKHNVEIFMAMPQPSQQRRFFVKFIKWAHANKGIGLGIHNYRMMPHGFVIICEIGKEKEIDDIFNEKFDVVSGSDKMKIKSKDKDMIENVNSDGFNVYERLKANIAISEVYFNEFMEKVKLKERMYVELEFILKECRQENEKLKEDIGKIGLSFIQSNIIQNAIEEKVREKMDEYAKQLKPKLRIIESADYDLDKIKREDRELKDTRR
jgi:hypothetical protein